MSLRAGPRRVRMASRSSMVVMSAAVALASVAWGVGPASGAGIRASVAQDARAVPTAVALRAEATDSPCRRVFYLAARGSGQPLTEAGGMGTEVSKAFSEFRTQVAGIDVQGQSLKYPAYDYADIYTGKPGRYFGGLEAGVQEALTILRARASQCEALALFGFSQGSMVMHRVLVELQESKNQVDQEILSRVLAAVLVADGDRSPSEAVHAFGTGRTGEGISFSSTGISRVRSKTLNSVVADRVFSACDRSDIVCDPGWQVNAGVKTLMVNAAVIAGCVGAIAICLANPVLWIGVGVSSAVAIAAIKRAGEVHGGYRSQDAALVQAARAAGTRVAERLDGSGPRVSEPRSVDLTLRADSLTVLSAAGGAPPYAWSFVRGSMPTGLSLSASGVVSGRPIRAGLVAPVVRVVDARGVADEAAVEFGVRPRAPDPTVATKIVAGSDFTCALTATKQVSCWGSGRFGQNGTGDGLDAATPRRVTGLPDTIIDLVAGGLHACALTEDRQVYCWGYNDSGQLGDYQASGIYSVTPVKVQQLPEGVASLAASNGATCALTGAGAVYCWGLPIVFGIYGDWIRWPSYPSLVDGLESGVRKLWGGSSNFCVLMASGSTRCWGAGQFLNADTTVDHPSVVPSLAGPVSNLAVGFLFGCAVLGESDVTCWGTNSRGEAGNGTYLPDYYTYSPPSSVRGLGPRVRQVGVGGNTVCAVTEVGTVLCWGDSTFGQVGNGLQTNDVVHGVIVRQLTPAPVKGIGARVLAVAVGVAHACALTTAGAVLCWGWNDYGQLGNGSVGGIVPTATPVVMDLPLFPVDLDADSRWRGSTYECHETESAFARSKGCSRGPAGAEQFSAIDLNLPGGTESGVPVRAVESGTIDRAYLVSIKHDRPLYLRNGTRIEQWYSLYGHMTGLHFRKGDHVNKGDVIGYVSNRGCVDPGTGGACDPHLHFAMFRRWGGGVAAAISPWWLPGAWSSDQCRYSDDLQCTRLPPGLYEARIFRDIPTS